MRIAEFKFDRLRDIAWSAERARLLGSLAGLPQKRRTNFGKAVKEIVDYAVAHERRGTIQFGIQTQGGKKVEAIIRYEQDDKTTESERQLDGDSIRALIGELEIVSSERVVQIRLAEPLPNEAPRIPHEVASDWATALATRNRTDALSLILRKQSGE